MTDQLRYNTGKPKLHYWYSTEASEFMFDSGRRDEPENMLAEWRWFLLGSTQTEDLLLSAIALCRAQGLDPAEAYSATCVYGESKYARGNFRKGASLCHYADCGLRHTTALHRGELLDPESGVNHAGHVLWNVACIYDMSCDPDVWKLRDDRLFRCGDFSGRDHTPAPAPVLDAADYLVGVTRVTAQEAYERNRQNAAVRETSRLGGKF